MKSDMWALGVTIYELFLKQKPFIAGNMDGLKALILHGEARDLEKLPSNARDIVVSLLKKIS